MEKWGWNPIKVKGGEEGPMKYHRTLCRCNFAFNEQEDKFFNLF